MVMGLIKGGDLWAVIHREDDQGEWISGFSEAQAKFYTLIIADTLVRNSCCYYRSSLLVFG